MDTLGGDRTRTVTPVAEEESLSGRAGVQLAWGAALVVSVVLYGGADSLEHFLWHLGYGGAAGLVAGAAGLRLGWLRRPRPTWFALAGYAFMAIPDVLWLLPTITGGDPWPHEPWMNVFLGHVALDAWDWATPALPFVLLAAAAVAFTMARKGQTA